MNIINGVLSACGCFPGLDELHGPPGIITTQITCNTHPVRTEHWTKSQGLDRVREDFTAGLYIGPKYRLCRGLSSWDDSATEQIYSMAAGVLLRWGADGPDGRA